MIALITVILPSSSVIVAQTASSSSAQQLFAAREQLDQTVWGPEVQAQHYERRFVQLWDDLLRRDDKFEILASVPFSTLSIGSPAEKKALDLGIQRTRFGQPERDLSPEDWKRLLTRFQSEGYQIEQTEWHHSSFQTPQEDSSTFRGVRGHSRSARESAARVILRATLAITWSPRVDTDDVPLPETIVVAGLEMLERHVAPVFAKCSGWTERPRAPARAAAGV